MPPLGAMPPLSSIGPFTSTIDGSFKVYKSSNHSRYGDGSLQIETNCDFFGSSDHYIRSRESGYNLILTSQKNIDIIAAVDINETAINNISHQASNNISQTADNGTFTATSNLDATIESVLNEARVFAGTKAHVKGATAKLESTGGVVDVSASTNVNIIGTDCLMTGSANVKICLLYTSPSPRDRQKSRMPSSA